MKRSQKYHEGRYSSRSSKEEEVLVISKRKETHEQQQSDVKKIENHFGGGFKRLKVKGLIRP